MSEHQPISVIVGLGNPGAEYERTRHNIGFMAIDHLANAWSIGLGKEKRFYGIFGEGRLTGATNIKVRLLKPTTYMNLSGQSVQACADWFKCEPHQVLVIYDDMDLPLGKLRLRPSGSAGGHNGMKSIISRLGTQEFPRLRLGIGRADRGKDDDKGVIKHVLGGFNTTEQRFLPDILQLTEKSIHSILTQGIAKTMSLYNNQTIELGN
ncbi:MAG: aminoacyl-tRNA hydrolase [Pseudanabaenaceae cyanobacterium bins.39]|nr:aminoacyl-tRNA hydrolase [Pseudanabaenaceae cyanobacterium bins.39]